MKRRFVLDSFISWIGGKKTENGTLEDRTGWKGLCRKGEVAFVLLAVQLGFHN